MVQNFRIVFNLWPLSSHSVIVLLKRGFYHIFSLLTKPLITLLRTFH